MMLSKQETVVEFVRMVDESTALYRGYSADVRLKDVAEADCPETFTITMVAGNDLERRREHGRW